MLIDFENLHRTYLIGRPVQGVWQFKPTNDKEPRTGFYPSSHQVFSNAGLQVALYLYNSVNDAGQCVGVSHCLYLNFTRKVEGSYLLNNDRGRIAFNLDIGLAGDLYSLVVGQADEFAYRAVRTGKAPKSIMGSAQVKDGRRVVVLTAESKREGKAVRIEVDLDRAAQIAVAANCLAYGRLLYPSFGDAAVQSLLSTPTQNFRACAEKGPCEPTPAVAVPLQSSPVSQDDSSRALAGSHTPGSPDIARLRKVIWAIGNQKWASMTLESLQRIQAISDASRLQALIDEANSGDFRSWDSFLR